MGYFPDDLSWGGISRMLDEIVNNIGSFALRITNETSKESLALWLSAEGIKSTSKVLTFCC